MEGFTTLDFIGDIYDISIGWVKPPKCRNNSLVPPPHTEYEPLNNAAVVYM